MQKCLFADVKKNNESKDIIQVTCVHNKTLPINQARAALGLRALNIEEQEEILKNRSMR